MKAWTANWVASTASLRWRMQSATCCLKWRNRGRWTKRHRDLSPDMYCNLGLFARAQFLTLFKTRFSIRRWAYVVFFTVLYWMMWFVVAFGRALDHVFFPGFKRQPVREPVFIVAPPRSGTTLTQKLMSLDEDRFVYNALYQTIFPAVFFQRCFDAMVWFDRKMGRPMGRIVAWAEKKWFGGWDD